MRFGVLGTLYAASDSQVLGLGGPVQRRVLAALLARAPSVVSAESLIDDVWGESPPASAAGTLHSHVARLRDALGRNGWPGIETVPGGYRLPLGRSDLDAWVFEDLVASARGASDPQAVTAGLGEALALWRGPAYADFLGATFVDGEATRLEALRAAALEDRIEADLQAGRGPELVPELEALVAEHPFRERLWAALVVALYRAGRQADALGAYQRARSVLAAELGVEPGPALREAERRVLAQDPALTAQAAPAVSTCPWKGLVAYDETDADFFFGRDRVVTELVGRLVDNAVVVVTGASGSGKSSVVRAGLLSALSQGAVIGSGTWPTAVLVPGPDASSSVDTVLAPGVDLLVVDQAEELFTLNDDATVRAVAERLLAAVDRGMRLVLVLRGDLYGRLAELSGLATRMGSGTVLVGLPEPADLRRMVEEPAARVGLDVEPGLVEAVLSDIGGRPGALPLMSTALVRAWERRDGRTLTLAGYLAGGGVTAALERLAEEAYASLDDAAGQAARRILLRLAGSEDGRWVRRRVRLEELAPPGDAAAGSALAALTTRRLVTVGRADAQVSHEALFAAWPRLGAWLDERAAIGTLIDHLTGAAHAWETGGRDPSDLYRGTRLQSALDLAATHPEELGPSELEFVAAGRLLAEDAVAQERARTAEQAKLTADQARGRRRLRLVAAGLIVGLVLAIGSGGLAVRKGTEAADAARLDDARRLGVEALSQGDRSLGLLLAVAGMRLDDTAATEGDLLATLVQATPTATQTLTGAVRGVAVSSDGSIAVAQADNSILVTPSLHETTDQNIYPFQFGGDLAAVQMAPRSDVVYFGATGSARILHWDPAGGGAAVLDVRGWDPTSFGLSLDGDWLVGLPAPPTVGNDRRELWVHDLAGSATDQHVQLAGVPVAVRVGGSRAVVLEAAGELEVVDISRASRRERKGLSGVDAAAISPDGGLLAVARPHGEIDLVDLPTMRSRGTLTGAQAAAAELAFSPDGGKLAAAGGAGEPVLAWDLKTRSQMLQLPPQEGPVTSLVWNGGGTELYTAVQGQPNLRAWSASGSEGVARTVLAAAVASGRVTAASMDVATRRLAVGTATGEVWFLDLDSGAVRASARPPDSHNSIASIQFAEHGTLALTADVSGILTSWHVATATPIGTLTQVPIKFGSENPTIYPEAAVAPDGHTAASYPDGPSLQIFDLRNQTPLRQFAASQDVPTRGQVLGWTPDGSSVVVEASDDLGSLVYAVVDARSGALRWQQPAAVSSSEAAFLDQGRTVVMGGADGVLRVFDTSTGQIAGSVAVDTAPVTTLSVTPDGRLLATGGPRGSVRIWDTATRQQMGASLPFPSGDLVATRAVSNREIVAVGADGAVWVYDLEPAHWAALACSEAARTLTPTEWQRFVPDQPYSDPCPTRTAS